MMLFNFDHFSTTNLCLEICDNVVVYVHPPTSLHVRVHSASNSRLLQTYCFYVFLQFISF